MTRPRTTNLVSGLVRFFIALITLIAAIGAFSIFGWQAILTFTVLSNALMVVSFVWTGITLLGGKRTPYEPFAGSAVFYLIITGLVFNLVLSPGSYGSEEAIIFGWSASDVTHVINPLLAFAVWIVFAEHRRIPWKFVYVWLYLLIGYLVVILAAIEFIPAIAAPYEFLDAGAIGWGGVIGRVSLYVAVFAALAAAMIALDRKLPANTRVSEYDPYDQ